MKLALIGSSLPCIRGVLQNLWLQHELLRLATAEQESVLPASKGAAKKVGYGLSPSSSFMFLATRELCNDLRFGAN